ncbi:autotransporter-associated beta strand repeat-containing protein, partial [Pseudomonas sp. B329]|uniref:autotransporter-associated beta strand repeat-containing protein n=1 Tax=Pseudomonas sp. B329 TaxID=1553459 RepID=UPI0020054B6C
MKITNRSRGSHRKATVITTSALLLGLCVPEAIAEEKIPKNFSIKTMVFNIWNHAESSKIWKSGSTIDNLTYSDSMRELLLGVSPDILVLPELDNNAKAINTEYGDQVYDAFKQNTNNVLNSAPRKQDSFVDFRKNEDTYPKGSPEYINRDEDNEGLYFKGIGSVFSSVPFKELPGDSIRINPGNGFPVGVVTGIHLDYSDSSHVRVSEAQDFNKAAAASNVPMIILGDFNAGDVSERGLNRKTQQSLVFGTADKEELHYALAYEYMDGRGSEKFHKVAQTVQDYYGKEAKIHGMKWEQWAKALDSAIQNNKDTGLQDETYPVNSNIPRTLNTFKRQYQLFQLDQNRELFQPSQVGDQRATWTSDGENQTNKWPGWDRVTIDHIMVSRPFAKWIEIADDGKLSGNLSKQAKLPNNTDSLSDHEPVAQNLRWVGPQLEVYEDVADKQEKTRLVWGSDAYNFAGRNKKFNLVRNNYRNDVYLGQVSDEAGTPTLTWLTLPEKMDLLNCSGSKSKLQQAVDDYCIDNHSFIGETLVKDGGLLVVDEDKALGGSKAKLRLANGGLRVAGLSMPELDREIVLEQQGWIDIAESDLVVSAKKAVTGTGSLTKLGAGTLALSGPNSYTGGTLVEEGILRADTGVGFVNNTAYSINGGALDLNGFDLIASKLEGKGGAVRLGAGSLTLDQSVNTRYDGSIEGSGGLTKSGSGGLILNGQNSYTGATLVRDGHLVIGDSDHPDARLESPVTVSPGATLGGIGTLGALTINAGGRIAPGNSIGTLHTGDVTFDAGSVYSVEVGPNGRSDLIDSAGVATLNGGEVRVSLENRSNLLTEDEAKTLVGQTFNILTAKKGIVGQFASITPNYLFLDSQISVPRTQQLLNGPPVPAASAIPGATVPPVADAQIVAAPAPAEPGAPETTVPPVADAQIVAA